MFRSHKLFLALGLVLVTAVTQAQTQAPVSVCVSGCEVGMMVSYEGARPRLDPTTSKWPVRYPPIIEPVDPRPMYSPGKKIIEIPLNYLPTAPAGVTQFGARPGPIGGVSARLSPPIPMSWPPANYK
jgi:hypothetical protein